MEKLFARNIKGKATNVSEERKRPELRKIIEDATPRQKTALIFLARGAKPDKLDALEKGLPRTSISVLKTLPLASKRMSTILLYTLVDDGKIEYLEDLEDISRMEVLKTKNIGIKTVDVLAEFMAKRGIYFKGERPNE